MVDILREITNPYSLSAIGTNRFDVFQSKDSLEFNIVPRYLYSWTFFTRKVIKKDGWDSFWVFFLEKATSTTFLDWSGLKGIIHLMAQW